VFAALARRMRSDGRKRQDFVRHGETVARGARGQQPSLPPRTQPRDRAWRGARPPAESGRSGLYSDLAN
jgi:hypothetical protein